MGMWVGRGRKARAAYGFDDIALVPGALTVNPTEVDISWDLCGRRFDIPIIAAAMDGVVGPKLAVEMGRLGVAGEGRVEAREAVGVVPRGRADHADPRALPAAEVEQELVERPVHRVGRQLDAPDREDALGLTRHPTGA